MQSYNNEKMLLSYLGYQSCREHIHTLSDTFWSMTKRYGNEILHLCISDVISLSDNTAYPYHVSAKSIGICVSDYLTLRQFGDFAEHYEIHYHSYSLKDIASLANQEFHRNG